MSFLHSRDNSESANFPETSWYRVKNQEEEEEGEREDISKTIQAEGSIAFRCAPMLGVGVVRQHTPTQAQMFYLQAEAERCISSQGVPPLLGTIHKRDQRSCWNTDKNTQDANLRFQSRNCHNSTNMHDRDNRGSSKEDQDQILVESSKWHVSRKSVPTVPKHYPLERTHVAIPLACMSTELIATLICLLCQKFSLAAEYNHEKAIATLTASDGTHFLVTLFGQKDGTILECQKMSGDSETFYRNAMKLVQVAKGVDHVISMIPVKSTTRPPTSFSDWKEIQAGRMEDVDMLELPSAMRMDEKSEHSMACEQVEWAAELLNKDRIDANDLGMEMLVTMTDYTKSSAVTCIVTSTAVLRGYIVADHHFNRKHEKIDALRFDLEHVFAPLIGSSSYAGGEEAEAFDEDEMTMSSSSYLTWRRLLSMQILENALRVCCNQCDHALEEELLSDRDLPCSSWLLRHMDLIVSTLVQAVHAANDKPHDAVLATKCLDYLMKMSPRAKMLAYDQNIVQAVNRANAVGKCSHAILEQESARVHRTLMGQQPRFGACSSFAF